MHFSFNNPLPIVYIIIFFIVSFVIAFFYYRNTKVESSKNILIALRTFFIFFLLLLFISPLASYLKKDSAKITSVILTDNSKSEQIENRSRIVNSTLQPFSKSDDYKTLNFSGDKPDTSSFNNNITDINQAFEKILQDNVTIPGSVTIISDGMFNHGRNALLLAQKLQCPVNYILTGDTVQKKDILISDIYYNKTSFIDSRTQVKVQIKSFGYIGSADVSLYLENNLIEKKNISLDASKENYEVEFYITSSREGFTKYRAEVSKQGGEITELNNSKDFVIEFLDNKFDVLFLAGGPSSDVSFIKDEIARISNIRSFFYTQKNANEFYEGTGINFEKKDAIVLIGYPTSVSNTNLINSIKDALSNGTTSLIFIESRNIEYEKLKLFGSFLPFDIGSASNTEEETALNGLGKVNESFTTDLSRISGLNPVFRNRTFSNARSNSTSYISTKSGLPALIINNSAVSGNAAFLFHGMYRWKLSSNGNYPQNFFGELFLNTLKNIVKKDEQKDIEIFINEDMLANNELMITARLDSKLQINDSKIKTTLRIGNDPPENIYLNKISGNQFEYRKKINSNVSDIRVYAEVENAAGSNGAKIDDSIRVVTDNNFEYRETKAERSQLKELALNTGGSDFTGLSNDDITKAINDQSKKFASDHQNKDNEYYKRSELKFNGYYLIFMLLFLFSEWILRKRRNLV